MISGIDKIVYILSDQRSGSTIADTFVSSHFNAFSAGEVINFHHYWRCAGSGAGSTRDWVCRCGSKLPECFFWCEVMNSYVGDGREVMEADFDLAGRKSIGAHLALVFTSAERAKKGDCGKVDKLKRFYSAVASVSGERIIVDSSKSPLQLDRMLADPEVRSIANVIILTRDARAVCHSVVKRAAQGGVKRSSLRSYVRWSLIYMSGLLSLRRKREVNTLHVSYEDICDKPNVVISSIMNRFSIGSEGLREACSRMQRHNIGGTPRSIESTQTFQKDEAWKSERTLGNRFWYFIALPLNVFFGYR